MNQSPVVFHYKKAMWKDYHFPKYYNKVSLSPFPFCHPETTLQDHKNLRETELWSTMLFYLLWLNVRNQF